MVVNERLKQTRTLNELSTGYAELHKGEALKINVPVLDVVGRYDIFGCRSALNNEEGSDCSSAERLLAEEAPNWSPKACLAVGVLPDAGHNINLERNARSWFAAADAWLRVTFDDRRGDRWKAQPRCEPHVVPIDGR